MSEKGLLRIGKLLVENVRNLSIGDIRDTLHGRMKGEDADRIRASLGGIDSEALEKFSEVVPELVDQVIHNLCVLLEEADDLDLVLQTESGEVRASAESDGLAGELYGDRGWIARYGSQNSAPG